MVRTLSISHSASRVEPKVVPEMNWLVRRPMMSWRKLVVPHPGQGQRVQHLQQQGADTADEHAGEIPVHLPADAARTEQPGVALGLFEVELAQGQAREAQQLCFDTAA